MARTKRTARRLQDSPTQFHFSAVREALEAYSRFCSSIETSPLAMRPGRDLYQNVVASALGLEGWIVYAYWRVRVVELLRARVLRDLFPEIRQKIVQHAVFCREDTPPSDYALPVHFAFTIDLSRVF